MLRIGQEIAKSTVSSPNTTTIEVSKRGEEPSVVSIVTATSKELVDSYKRLHWTGFSATSGALIIIASFVCSLLPKVSFPIQSQILFSATGFGMLLLSAAVLALQRFEIFRLNNRNLGFTLKTLELGYDEAKEIKDEAREIRKAPPPKPPDLIQSPTK